MACPIEQRKLGMTMQMNELRLRHGGNLAARLH